jgi:hypothetical protein
MTTVRIYIEEIRRTIVEMEVDDALLADPAEHRDQFLRSVLTQPVEAVLANRELVWSNPTHQISHVQADAHGDTYEQRPWRTVLGSGQS